MQPILEGEIAPFNGQLLTTKKALADGQTIERCFTKNDLLLEKERSLLRLDLDAEKQRCKIILETCELKNESLILMLEDEKRQDWYEHPIFTIITTIVVMTGVYIGAVKTVEAL